MFECAQRTLEPESYVHVHADVQVFQKLVYAQKRARGQVCIAHMHVCRLHRSPLLDKRLDMFLQNVRQHASIDRFLGVMFACQYDMTTCHALHRPYTCMKLHRLMHGQIFLSMTSDHINWSECCELLLLYCTVLLRAG